MLSRDVPNREKNIIFQGLHDLKYQNNDQAKIKLCYVTVSKLCVCKMQSTLIFHQPERISQNEPFKQLMKQMVAEGTLGVSSI